MNQILMINAVDAILDGTYDPSKWGEYFFDAGKDFNQPLPKGFACDGEFWFGKKFSYSIPKWISCNDIPSFLGLIRRKVWNCMPNISLSR